MPKKKSELIQEELEETRDVTKAREAEDVTPEVADEIVEEVIDLKGRRRIDLSKDRFVYIRMPRSGEDTKAAEVYAKTLYEYKKNGIPFVASVARMILSEVDNPETFGKRERRIINQEEINLAREANKTLTADYEKTKENDPKTPEPELIDVPEPLVDDGSDSLKAILDEPTLGPYAKTQAIMECLSSTEYANLIMHTAEYMAGRARTKYLVNRVVETGVEVNGDITFKRLWKNEDEMDEESPDTVGYLEGAYMAYQQEVLSQDFLQRLSSDLEDGNTKN